MMVQGWIGPEFNLVLYRRTWVQWMFCHLRSCISLGGHISDEVCSDVQKPRLVFTNWRHSIIDQR